MALSSDDAKLVRAIVNADDDAIALLDQRFRSRIEAFARRRHIPSQDCGDVAQEVLTDAIRQIQAGHFRERAALSTWFHTIMTGKVADYWRKRTRKRNDGPLVSLQDVGDSEHLLVAANNSDTVLAVRQALSRLSSHDQLLLILHEQRGYTLEEIGSLMGLGKSAIAERLEHAREHFRTALQEGGRRKHNKRLTE